MLADLLCSAGKHTIFGRISAGMEVVKRLGSIQTDKTDRCSAILSTVQCSVVQHS